MSRPIYPYGDERYPQTSARRAAIAAAVCFFAWTGSSCDATAPEAALDQKRAAQNGDDAGGCARRARRVTNHGTRYDLPFETPVHRKASFVELAEPLREPDYDDVGEGVSSQGPEAHASTYMCLGAVGSAPCVIAAIVDIKKKVAYAVHDAPMPTPLLSLTEVLVHAVEQADRPSDLRVVVAGDIIGTALEHISEAEAPVTTTAKLALRRSDASVLALAHQYHDQIIAAITSQHILAEHIYDFLMPATGLSMDSFTENNIVVCPRTTDFFVSIGLFPDSQTNTIFHAVPRRNQIEVYQDSM